MKEHPKKKRRPGKRSKARRRALQALYQADLSKDAASTIIKQFREEQNMDTVDVEFFEQLVRGVVEDLDALDEAIKPCSDVAWENVDVTEKSVLRIAQWEFKNSPAVHAAVVIDEAIELTKIFGGTEGHNFVNAVLDKLARQMRAGELPDHA
ncbi:MAG: transcription antitermination factor NusB [bacterium]